MINRAEYQEVDLKIKKKLSAAQYKAYQAGARVGLKLAEMSRQERKGYLMGMSIRHHIIEAQTREVNIYLAQLKREYPLEVWA